MAGMYEGVTIVTNMAAPVFTLLSDMTPRGDPHGEASCIPLWCVHRRPCGKASAAAHSPQARPTLSFRRGASCPRSRVTRVSLLLYTLSRRSVRPCRAARPSSAAAPLPSRTQPRSSLTSCLLRWREQVFSRPRTWSVHLAVQRQQGSVGGWGGAVVGREGGHICAYVWDGAKHLIRQKATCPHAPSPLLAPHSVHHTHLKVIDRSGTPCSASTAPGGSS